MTERRPIQFRLLHAGLLLIAVILGLALTYLLALSHELESAEAYLESACRPYRLIAQAGEALRSYYSASSYLLAYAFTRDEDFDAQLARAISKFRGQVDSLARTMKSSPDLPRELASKSSKIGDMTARGLQETMVILRDRWEFITPADIRRIQSSQDVLMTGFHNEVAQSLYGETENRQKAIAEEEKVRLRVKLLVLSGFVLTAVVSVLLIVIWIKGVTNRISLLTNNANRLGKGLPLLERRGGYDEIAALERVFHDVDQRLQQSLALKREFRAFLNYELRSSLTSIDNTLARAQNGEFGLGERAINRVGKSRRSCDRLLSLIEEMMDAEEIEAGAFSIRLEQVEITDVLRAAIDDITPTASTRSIEIVLESERCVLAVDPTRIQQVVVNLLSNAIKYSDNGSTVELQCKRTEPGIIEVRVSDHGPGIPAQFMDKLFQRYQQSSDAKPGTGLGLYIAKCIILKHGGTIGALNQDGGGAQFWFQVPMKELQNMSA